MIIDQYVFAKYEPFLICMAVVIVILNETNQTWNEIYELERNLWRFLDFKMAAGRHLGF